MPDLTIPPPTSLKALKAFLFRHPRVRVRTRYACYEARCEGLRACPGFTALSLTVLADGASVEIPLAGLAGDPRRRREIGLEWREDGLTISAGVEGDPGRIVYEVQYVG